jgi:hypothetical protein
MQAGSLLSGATIIVTLVVIIVAQPGCVLAHAKGLGKLELVCSYLVLF